ncbi:hypothetical protein O3G_MSEX013535 [Manduca sexta]|uniref:CARD domain-containing protein n=1 Tax=Manduca sexta TaxID=7130 RepID=A0A922CYB1_MANSE|nr:hypothetical protein O3G_MSEX013535 [Manduca sexta]
MQQEHKRAIQLNFSSLVDRTDLKMMVSALYEKGVFSEAMLEPYSNENISQLDRKRHLFHAITRRGPEAFAKLTEALVEMGQWDLVRDLDPNSPVHPRSNRPELRLNMPRKLTQ